jgi:predicted nucleic acid-binding protein
MRALLDTSVLIALLDANHLQHPLCHRWLATQQDDDLGSGDEGER